MTTEINPGVSDLIDRFNRCQVDAAYASLRLIVACEVRPGLIANTLAAARPDVAISHVYVMEVRRLTPVTNDFRAYRRVTAKMWARVVDSGRVETSSVTRRLRT